MQAGATRDIVGARGAHAALEKEGDRLRPPIATCLPEGMLERVLAAGGWRGRETERETPAAEDAVRVVVPRRLNGDTGSVSDCVWCFKVCM